MTERADGPDISTWQRSPSVPGEPKPALLYDNEDFVIFKASQDKREDEDFRWWYENLKGKVPITFYHFANYMQFAAPQADYFCDLIANYPVDFPAALDFEYTGAYGSLPAAYSCVQWILDFKNLYKARTDTIPMLYVNGSTVLYLMRSNHPRLSELFEMPLWLAYPGAEKNIETYGYTGGWKEWKFWQYTWKMSGYENGVESADLDYNFFNGTPAEFRVWSGIDEPTPPPTEPADINPELMLIRDALDAIERKHYG